MYGKYNILSNEKHNFLKYVVWQPLYMQTVTSAENGGTERADFQVPNYGNLVTDLTNLVALLWFFFQFLCDT